MWHDNVLSKSQRPPNKNSTVRHEKPSFESLEGCSRDSKWTGYSYWLWLCPAHQPRGGRKSLLLKTLCTKTKGPGAPELGLACKSPP